ncbi:MAG: pyridoxamine 5'-phosphate oxidase family protein [Firmicutes bacterium]|nr:pyridoxamine 5'-phosphate oxidase family protein [Bacillota bacterium]
MDKYTMRRKDRQVSDAAAIFDMVYRCQVLRLALPDKDAPYVVPLSFGVEQIEGRLVFYAHSAKIGRKIDLIGAGASVGVELDRFLGYGGEGRNSTAYYESVVGRGRAELIEGEQALHGLELLMEHCGREKQDFAGCLPHTAVLRVTLDEVSAKANPLPEK